MRWNISRSMDGWRLYINQQKCTVIVDYAHNAVSMESLLLTLRDQAKASRLRLRMRRQPGAGSPVLDGRDWRKAGRSVDHHGG